MKTERTRSAWGDVPRLPGSLCHRRIGHAFTNFAYESFVCVICYSFIFLFVSFCSFSIATPLPTSLKLFCHICYQFLHVSVNSFIFAIATNPASGKFSHSCPRMEIFDGMPASRFGDVTFCYYKFQIP